MLCRHIIGADVVGEEELIMQIAMTCKALADHPPQTCLC
jgi:hypothetical protein